MKASLRWLKEYVDVSLPHWELAHRLTMSGTEVGGIEVRGGAWENVLVGQVVALEPHPNADRLQLVTVDLGTQRTTVVAGAFNIKVGDKVPFAQVGARILDGHTGEPTIVRAARIRGVASQGMCCSEKELGISEDHQGIMVLPPEAPLGALLADYLGDTILDLEITPNRPDCLSMIGVAREVAALTGQRVRLPQVSYLESEEGIEALVSVAIADPDLCPRYCASLVRGVKIGPSPTWMQERLIAYGMRPINNVVDVTNYVMIEYGQPLHAFDFARITGGRIIVRCARWGEMMLTLDGVERALEEGMLLITDPEGPIAVAGVMGGLASEVREETTSILLESANFHPTSIRRTSASLRLRSESSSRFDKGLSPELPLPALRRATHLIIELAGGRAARGVIDVYPGRREREPILFSTNDVRRILGVELSRERISEVLSALGFQCEPTAEDALLVGVPYWRTEVALAEDLAEEVARIIGYDEIPTTPLGGRIPKLEADPVRLLADRLRDALVALGMQEVITYPLTSRTLLEKVLPLPLDPEPVRVANPMTREQEYLRTTLRASLLNTLAANRRHEEGGIRLFELGKVYLPRQGDLPEEREVLAGVLSGPREERSWLGSRESTGFFDLKGIVERLMERLGVRVSFALEVDAGLHPGATAAILAEGKRLGILGQVHPRICDTFEITENVYLFEMELARLLPIATAPRRYHPLPRFPGIQRDLALLMDLNVPASRVEEILRASPLVEQVTLFDLYVGEQIPSGKKSLACSILYRSPERTLTDEEVNQAQEGLIRRLEVELGAQVRQ